MTPRAIILVGGRGTRLQPLTDSRPKPMLPLVDRPFLAWQLAWLRSHGVTAVTFACGFLPQQIAGHFGDGSAMGMQLDYVIEPEPLGTGGAIAFAARSAGRERVIVCNGDVLTGLDLTALLAEHERSGARGTIALTPVEDPTRYGLVRTDAGGRVTGFLEKPSADEVDTNLINAGTYVLEPEAIDLVPDTGACSIERDVFPELARQGSLQAMGSDAYWIDIGTVPSLLRATEDLLGGRVDGVDVAGLVDEGSRIRIDPTATVDDSVQVTAPALVGPGARVEPGARIGPGSVIGAGAVIGRGARIVRSVIYERAVIEPDVQMTRSIVGEDARVASGVALADGAVVGPGVVEQRRIVRGGV